MNENLDNDSREQYSCMTPQNFSGWLRSISTFVLKNIRTYAHFAVTERNELAERLYKVLKKNNSFKNRKYKIKGQKLRKTGFLKSTSV